MKKTIRINISGLIFNLDEDAYSKLQKYLNSITNKFLNTEEGNEVIADVEARIAELDGHKNDSIVLHCRSGRRAVTADEILQANGFMNITELEGHMLDWEAGGHPVEKPANTPPAT